MSCRTNAYSSAQTTFARLTSGLSDVQTLSAYHQLRAQGRGTTPPTTEQWAEFIGRQVTDVRGNTDFTDARRASLLTRFERARTGVRPDGPSWYALRNIRDHTSRQSEAVNTELARCATDSGLTTAQARARFNELADDANGSGVVAPPGYTHLNNVEWRQHGFPQDQGTQHALMQMQADAYTARQSTQATAPPRVTRQPVENHFIGTMGYNPEGGRLEVTFARTPERVYAYANVPEATWARMNDRDNNSLGRIYTTEIRNNDDTRYANDAERDRDATGYRCESCGQFRSVLAHTCPTAAPSVPTPVRRPARRRVAAAPAVAEVQAESVAEPVVETEPEPVVVPEPVVEPVVTDVPMTRVNRQIRRSGSYGSYTSFLAPSLPQTRRGLRDGGVVRTQFALNTPYIYQANRAAWPELDDEFFADRNNMYPAYVRGSVDLQRDAEGAIRIRAHQLTCTCSAFRRNGTCGHIGVSMGLYETGVTTVVNATPGVGTPRDPAVAQAAAEFGLRQDWMRSEAHAAEARARWAASAPEDSYSDNFAAFESDYQAALDRKAEGQPAIPYMTENATGGLCAPAGGRTFGVELEFDVEPGVDRYEALRAIGADMHAAGLTPTPNQRSYHSDRTTYFEHQGGWKFETDCTVHGEIISPACSDTPETWANIQKVCDIIKAHGGRATARTGSHVHVSTGTFDHTPANHTELVRMVNQHEDVLYRASTNPDRPKHRPLQWCGPNRDVPNAGYDTVDSARYANNGHNYAINMQSVNGRTSDHAEFRHWDGTLDPAAIQAQVKISAAITEAAQRNAGVHGPSQRGSERRGAHKARVQAVRGGSRRALTSEELAADTATARSLADTMFTRREDKAQFAALFAVTSWQG